MLHASVPVFSTHKGGHITKHRSSPLHRSSPPGYQPIHGPYPFHRFRSEILGFGGKGVSVFRAALPPISSYTSLLFIALIGFCGGGGLSQGYLGSQNG